MNAPEQLLDFQLAFGRRIRDPRRAPLPAGVPPQRMAVYQELLFNNLSGFLDACYPVCRQMLGEARWLRLQRRFFRDWRCSTPWFREIPREFLDFLASRPGLRLPQWFPALAHYEWAELAVDIMPVSPPPHDPAGDLLLGRPLPNPAALLLHYDWPVQRIGPSFRPRRRQPTSLLVYRDPEERVQFCLLNPVSARLLALLQDGEAGAALSGEQACRRIAAELAHPQPEAVLQHGLTQMQAWREQGVLLGTRRAITE
ncbi:MAG: hypothetical protein RIR00_1926 [Pseudomonadota bacterium]|jgi:hypothetical protein